MVSEPADTDTDWTEIDDSELGRLLNDAYDAPPVPRSLLVKIERGVRNEWGDAPRLSESRWERLSRLFSRKSRWMRVVPAVVTVVLVAMIALSVGTSSSAWAAMLEALEGQDSARIESEDGIRWLSMRQGLVVEQSNRSTELFDLKNKLFLIRAHGSDQVYRKSFSRSKGLTDQNALMLAFLLGPSQFESLASAEGELTFESEQVESVTTPDGAGLALRVVLAPHAGDRRELSLTVNPETYLPVSLVLAGKDSAVKQVPVSFPTTDLTALMTQEFPSELSMVDTTSSLAAISEAVAFHDNDDPNLENNTANANVPNQRIGVDWTLPEANPSQWSKVDVKPVSADEIVEQIDRVLAERWKQLGIEPAKPAEDLELLRRVYLDIAGRTPSVHEVRSYLNQPVETRYEEVVDRLIKSADHASHLATVWRTFLLPEGVDLSAFGGVEAFDEWLAGEFASGQSYDEIVRKLLLAEGRLSRSGPLLFYSAVKLDPNHLAARTSRVFLGMRLECAECHDHPFEPWTQDDFWGMAAFFAQISRPQGELTQVSSVMRVHDIERGDVMLPESKQIVAPKFLDSESAIRLANGTSRREALARWITDSQNPYFARATVNRVWGHMFGKGIVDPIDDFGMQNRPKLPELIDLLASHFISTKFDLREVVRTIALSQAYRLSSGSETADESRLEWFAQMNVKMLTAAQVYDCISVATLLENGASAPGGLSIDRFDNTQREQFLQQFSTPAGTMTDYLGGIPQALTLMNGGLINQATGVSSSGLLRSLEAPFFTNRQRIEILYLATLSRPPREAEWARLDDYIAEGATGQELNEGLSDILWVLLNSAEFTMNH